MEGMKKLFSFKWKGFRLSILFPLLCPVNLWNVLFNDTFSFFIFNSFLALSILSISFILPISYFLLLFKDSISFFLLKMNAFQVKLWRKPLEKENGKDEIQRCWERNRIQLSSQQHSWFSLPFHRLYYGSLFTEWIVAGKGRRAKDWTGKGIKKTVVNVD